MAHIVSILLLQLSSMYFVARVRVDLSRIDLQKTGNIRRDYYHRFLGVLQFALVQTHLQFERQKEKQRPISLL